MRSPSLLINLNERIPVLHPRDPLCNHPSSPLSLCLQKQSSAFPTIKEFETQQNKRDMMRLSSVKRQTNLSYSEQQRANQEIQNEIQENKQ